MNVQPKFDKALGSNDVNIQRHWWPHLPVPTSSPDPPEIESPWVHARCLDHISHDQKHIDRVPRYHDIHGFPAVGTNRNDEHRHWK